jgi:hypothetical protein
MKNNLNPQEMECDMPAVFIWLSSLPKSAWFYDRRSFFFAGNLFMV